MTDIQDLMARMLTCAARIAEVENTTTTDSEMRSVLPVIVTKDACSLLIEAARELEILREPAPKVLEGELIDETVPIPEPSGFIGVPGWVGSMDTLPTRPHEPSPRACPHCGSHASKRVTRGAGGPFLTCPVCSHVWQMPIPKARRPQ
jgi:hypothetical protein